MTDQPIERNSSGERLYHDTSGAKCNIRGMIKREPGWVASRFDVMTDQLADAKAEIDEAKANYSWTGDGTPLTLAEIIAAKDRLLEERHAALAAADKLASQCVDAQVFQNTHSATCIICGGGADATGAPLCHHIDNCPVAAYLAARSGKADTDKEPSDDTDES